MLLTRPEKKLLFFFTGVIFLALLLASFVDLPLSQAVADQSSIFGVVFQIAGMFPEPYLLSMSASILAFVAYRYQKITWGRYVSLVFFLLVSFWGIYDMIEDWFGHIVSLLYNIQEGLPLGVANHDLPYSHLWEVLLSAGIWLLSNSLIVRWLQSKTDSQLRYLTLVAVAAMAFYYLSGELVSVMKDYWGRYRPHEISGQVDGAVFTNWWQLNGITGHRSFPSGHTMAGMSAIFYTFFIDRGRWKVQQYFAYGAVGYGFLMGLSRVRIGAHFLSDVTVSAATTFFIAFLLMRLLGIYLIDEEGSIQATDGDSY